MNNKNKEKKKKTGFSIVELLAVIVILAIIALIAIPMVLNVIKDSKKSSTARSAEMYLDAVTNSIANAKTNDINFNTTGTFTILEGGKKLQLPDSSETIDVDYKGVGIKEGSLVIENGVVTKINSGKIEDWFVKLVLGEVKLFDELKKSVLKEGYKFRGAISSLGGGSDSAGRNNSIN